jgi:predicted nucleic acid-binding protein
MAYLLDTNVVSELRKRKPHGAVVEWIREVPDESLYVSVVTLGEIQAGIEITREQDAGKAAEIEAWLDDLAQTYNVIDSNAAVFRQWARLLHGRSDHHLEDALIAATAKVCGLTVATRNSADFKPFAVDTIDPFRFKAG